jgi:hypothetical protein
MMGGGSEEVKESRWESFDLFRKRVTVLTHISLG